MILTTFNGTIVPLFSPLLPPLHLLSFSTLLGTQLFQTAIITRVTFTSLPRGPFVRLQKNLWPVYFRIQSLLFLVSSLTFPGTYKGQGLALVFGILVAGLNWDWAGPWARRIMLEKSELGQQGKTEAEQPGANVQMLNRKFKTSHAMSIHLNLVAIVATLWHGWGLASRLNI